MNEPDPLPDAEPDLDELEDAFEEPETATEFDTVAAVDLGSNSFHLVVATVAEDGTLTIVDRLKERVRLAGGLDAQGSLSVEAQQRALEALHRFGERLAGFAQGSVRACGTNTLRQARGALPFLVQARAALGHPIEIVSGREEARLIYLGVAHDQHFPGRQLVMDIGGGSTELIIGEGNVPQRLASLYMGCVSWSQRYFPDGALTRARFHDAITAARLQLEPIQRDYQQRGWDQAVGSSGTVLALERAVTGLGLCSSGVTQRALVKLTEQLVDAGHMDDATVPGVKGARVAVLPGGLAIVRAVLETFDIEHLRTSVAAMREGMLLDLLGRYGDADVRQQSVRLLARRYGVDLQHAANVATTALALLQAASTSWEITAPVWSLRLRWAAELHEVGMSIAYSGYHKHGAYLVRHSDLPGCSREDQETMAALVLSHRGRLARDRIAQIATGRVKVLLRLSVLLRLAVRLHRNRSPEPPPPVALTVLGKHLHLALPTGWLDAHPLTLADLEEEARQLSVAGFRLTIA